MARQRKPTNLEQRLILSSLSIAVATLGKALDALEAPQSVKDALLESGDLEHVQWWLEQRSNAEHSNSHPEKIS